MKTNKIKEEQICMCGHRIDDHLEQVNGKAKAGECSLCKCYYYCEDNSIQTKCKGETYEESNKRNNYFFEEGKIEGVKQATADLNAQIEALQIRIGNFHKFLFENKLTSKWEDWEFKDMPEREHYGKYLYEVIKSKSPEMPVGKKFWTNQKFTKVIGKSVELSDVKCRDYFIKLIKIEELKQMLVGK